MVIAPTVVRLVSAFQAAVRLSGPVTRALLFFLIVGTH